MTRPGLALLLLLAAAPARAETPLEDVGAFEHGFAVSLFQFDACGDQLAGRLFRRALAERVAQCPFSDAARARYARRTAAEFVKVRQRLAALVEQEGGLPHQIPGMGETCQEHRSAAPYRAMRGRIEAFGEGRLAADALLPAPCDAADILPE